MLNSKGEFNRCSIPRLSLPETGTIPPKQPEVEPEMEQDGRVEQDSQLEKMMLTGMYGTVGMEQSTKRVGEEMEPAGKRNKR